MHGGGAFARDAAVGFDLHAHRGGGEVFGGVFRRCVFDFARSGDDNGLLHIAIGQGAHGGKARGGIQK